MITKEQVADLQPGDVVEVSGYGVLRDATLRGPLRSGDGQTLSVGPLIVRHLDGRPAIAWEGTALDHTLTVVSRAPRPLYVNHPRTEPEPGDVVRDADGEAPWVAMRDSRCRWVDRFGRSTHPAEMPARLRLLVDGETGQVVQ